MGTTAGAGTAGTKGPGYDRYRTRGNAQSNKRLRTTGRNSKAAWRNAAANTGIQIGRVGD